MSFEKPVRRIEVSDIPKRKISPEEFAEAIGGKMYNYEEYQMLQHKKLFTGSGYLFIPDFPPYLPTN